MSMLFQYYHDAGPWLMGAVHFTRFSLTSNHSYLTIIKWILKKYFHILHYSCYPLLEVFSLSMAQSLNYGFDRPLWYVQCIVGLLIVLVLNNHYFNATLVFMHQYYSLGLY